MQENGPPPSSTEPDMERQAKPLHEETQDRPAEDDPGHDIQGAGTG